MIGWQKNMEFNHFLCQVQGLFHMMSTSLQTATPQLLLFKSDLHTALHGSLSPSPVSIKHLYKALKDSEPKLGAGRHLPASLRNIGWYFMNIPVVMLPNIGEIRLILDIPIINHNKDCSLYQVDQILVLKDGMVVSWELQESFVTVSHDRSQFMLLNQAEAGLRMSGGICKLTKPWYTTSYVDACLMALFSGRSCTDLESL